MLPCKCWEDIESHFMLKPFLLSGIELKFVNEVAGLSILLEPISTTTTNAIDGGVQCSSNGLDIFSPSIPKAWNKGNVGSLSLKSIPIQNFFSAEDLPVTYISNAENSNGRRRNPNKKITPKMLSES